MSTLGIDFGTTNSSVSYIKPDGKPEAIRFIGHDLKMPSVISFYSNPPMYGYEAQYLLDNIFGMQPVDQRLLVQKTVKSIKKILSPTSRIEGCSHQEIVAMFLRHLKEQAQESCPIQHFDKLVITHPVQFEEWKKKLYQDAALQADFDSVELLYEPVSAALGYLGTEQIQDVKGILVYDFGGGTFDVAYVTKQDGKFIVPLPPKGDSNCGGDDIDDSIYRLIVKKSRQVFGNEFETTRDLGLLFQCRRWKEMLSSMVNIPISVISKNNPVNRYSGNLTRKDIEEVALPYIDKTISLTKEVYDNVIENRLPIDFILLIGGSSSMPIIQEKIKETFPGLEIRTTGSADIAVALGASYYAVRPVTIDPENEWCYCIYDGKKILKSYNFCIYCGKPNFFKTGTF